MQCQTLRSLRSAADALVDNDNAVSTTSANLPFFIVSSFFEDFEFLLIGFRMFEILICFGHNWAENEGDFVDRSR